MTSFLEPHGSSSRVVALSGNPRSGSRTSLVARAVAEDLAGRLGFTEPVTSFELTDIAAQLFAKTATEPDRYRLAVADAAIAVVATPVYKASYTGLLKAFFDRFPSGGLRGVVAVPVVVSASPAHSFVAEHVLRPLLVDLGAIVPVKALAITERQLDDLDAVIGTWADEAAPVLGRLVGSAVPAVQR
jgi:FMN reductase